MLHLHEARWDEFLLAKLQVDHLRDDQGLPWGNRLKRVANRWDMWLACEVSKCFKIIGKQC